MNNLPLYPQEAYSEQNNARAFVSEKEEKPTPSFDRFQNPNLNMLMPLFIKLLGGNNLNLPSLESSNNPILNILSAINNNKKTPPKNEGEKDFPS